jgi:hypothetical protein
MKSKRAGPAHSLELSLLQPVALFLKTPGSN